MKIDRVKIKNFKSLRDVDLTLSNLTLLTGVNSSGKSSFIQTLLLLKQNQNSLNQFSNYHILKVFDSGQDNEIMKNMQKIINNIFLETSSSYVDLGEYKDILYQDVSDENIEISLFSSDLRLELSFDSKLKINIKDVLPPFNLFNIDFQYICTDRISPKRSYQLSDMHLEYNSIGITGEYTAHYLAENKNKGLLLEGLKHKDSLTNQLLENTSLWLSEVSVNIDIDSTVDRSLNSAKLTYNYKYSKGRTNKFNPLNVGFGITYVLPVIVAILKSKPDDLLIIENPESHLHPAGQAKIAELCAIASSCGVQIIVETHSDHFLNGLRVTTKKDIIKPKDSSIYYFSKDEDELETKINKLSIDKNGRINENSPKGFFDEYRIQLDKLLW